MNTLLRFPEGREKAFTLSYDDGVKQDKKLAEIFNKNGLKCTFNINSGYADGNTPNRMSWEDMKGVYDGHEVAVHALTHPFLEQMPSNMASYEIIEDRKNIEQHFGTIVRGSAYPYGTYNDTVVDILKNAGIVFARGTNSTHNFSIPTDWLRLRPTCHHNEPCTLELMDKFLGEHNHRAPWLFYLWGHSYEFDYAKEFSSWEFAEEFSKKIGGHKDVWYATNIEIYDYIDAFNKLLYSLDGKTIYNPTCKTVWFATDFSGKTYSIKPDETIKL